MRHSLEPASVLRPFSKPGGREMGRRVQIREPPLSAGSLELLCDDRQQVLCVEIAREGDTPIHVRVTLENGHQAWSSRIYVFANI